MPPARHARSIRRECCRRLDRLSMGIMNDALIQEHQLERAQADRQIEKLIFLTRRSPIATDHHNLGELPVSLLRNPGRVRKYTTVLVKFGGEVKCLARAKQIGAQHRRQRNLQPPSRRLIGVICLAIGDEGIVEIAACFVKNPRQVAGKRIFSIRVFVFDFVRQNIQPMVDLPASTKASLNCPRPT